MRSLWGVRRLYHTLTKNASVLWYCPLSSVESRHRQIRACLISWWHEHHLVECQRDSCRTQKRSTYAVHRVIPTGHLVPARDEGEQGASRDGLARLRRILVLRGQKRVRGHGDFHKERAAVGPLWLAGTILGGSPACRQVRRRSA